jgi:hypothetical protein
MNKAVLKGLFESWVLYDSPGRWKVNSRKKIMLNSVKDFFFSIFIGIYTAIIFAMFIGGAMLILKALSYFTGEWR